MTFPAATVTVGFAALNPPYAHSCTRHFRGRMIRRKQDRAGLRLSLLSRHRRGDCRSKRNRCHVSRRGYPGSPCRTA